MTEGIEITAQNAKGGHGDGGHGHLVTVKIDGNSKEIQARTYRVSELKTILGIPPEKELDEIVDGVIKALDDNANIHIKGGEVFISHVRSGGSS